MKSGIEEIPVKKFDLSAKKNNKDPSSFQKENILKSLKDDILYLPSESGTFFEDSDKQIISQRDNGIEKDPPPLEVTIDLSAYVLQAQNEPLSNNFIEDTQQEKKQQNEYRPTYFANQRKLADSSKSKSDRNNQAQKDNIRKEEIPFEQNISMQ